MSHSSASIRRWVGWLVDGEILLAPLVALILLFPSRFPVGVGIGLSALVAIWLVRWEVQKCPCRAAPLNLTLLVLLLSVPPAVWASAVPDLTTEALAYLLAGLIIFIAIVHWTCTSARFKWVWSGLALVGSILAVLAPLGLHFSPTFFPIPEFYTRWSGRLPETIHVNVMAGALVILWPICLMGPRLGPRIGPRMTNGKWRVANSGMRIATWLVAGLLLATLALTQSRGAYVAAAISGLTLLALRWPRVAVVIVPLALVAALVGGSIVGWDIVADQLTAGDVTSGLDGRIEIWSRAIYAIQDFPFTGLGLGTFERVVAILYPLFMNPAGTVPHAHNLFLQVAVDLGLPGLIAYLALLGLTFSCAFSAYRAFRLRGEGNLAGLCGGCIAGLVGMCVHGLIDAVAWGTKLAFIPWAVMGLVVALYLWSEREKERGGGAKEQRRGVDRADDRVVASIQRV